MSVIERLVVLILVAAAAPPDDFSGAEKIPLLGEVSVKKKEFLVGEPVALELRVRNLHGDPVYVRDMKGRYFELSAQDSIGKSLKSFRQPYFSGFIGTVQVDRGADFNDLVFVNRQVDFPGPGVYTVSYAGDVYVQKAPHDVNAQILSISGQVVVQLRRGSQTELEKALREYLKLLKSGNRRLESRAARALAVSDPNVAVKLLKKALAIESEDFAIYTSHAIWALAKIRTSEAIGVMEDAALGACHSFVRRIAIRELGRFEVRETVPTLVQLLSDPSAKIRRAALRALGNIGDPNSIEEVEMRLNDPDEKVRNTAEKVHKILRNREAEKKGIDEAGNATKESRDGDN